MKKLILSLSLSIVATCAAQAVDLVYNWQAGEFYFFSATVEDDIKTSMNIMGMSESSAEVYTTITQFGLYVLSVDADGKAKGMLSLQNFEIKDSKGRVLATLKDIPEKAIYTDVTVDKKGNFEFFNRVTMVVNESESVLLTGSISENSASASASAGGIKTTVYAKFDGSTGQLQAGYTVEDIGEKKTEVVKVNEESTELDVMPYEFLSLLALPEGDVKQGDKVFVQSGPMKVTVDATYISDGVAKINVKTATDKDADYTKTEMHGKSGDGSSSVDVEMDMDDFNDMGDFEDDDMEMDDMDGGDDMDMGGMEDMFGGMEGMMGMDGMKAATPDVQADMMVWHNYDKGMFEQIQGTSDVHMNMMGVKITVHSKLKMHMVP